MFLGGVGLFVLMSLALGLAPDTIWLDALRAVQGAAAAAALAGGSAALDQAYPDQGRTRAFSLLGTSFGVGLAAGPVLAGALLDTLGWRAVFLSSALVGAVALAIAAPTLRESRDPRAAGLDWRGTFGFTAALALLTWGILQAPGRDLTDARVLAPWRPAVRCCSCASSAASRGPCWICPCSAIHASSACRRCRWRPAIATWCCWC